MAPMKKTSLLALGLIATAFAVIGAHSLAERFDPTNRAAQHTTSALVDGDGPCAACDYIPS